MERDSLTSSTIDFLRFPLIVLVVCIHSISSWFASQPFNPSLYGLTAVVFVFKVLARMAVPLLFVISGYLYFLKYDGSRQFFIRQYERRLYSLLIPYVLWNLIFYAASVFGESGAIPVDADWLMAVFCNYDIANTDALSAIFSPMRTPIDFPLWYILDLMILSAAAPVIGYILRHKVIGGAVITLLTASFILGCWPLRFINCTSVVFFALGAYLSINRVDIDEWLTGVKPWHIVGIAVIWLAFAAADMALVQSCAALRCHALHIIVGVPLIFIVASRIVASGYNVYRALRRTSFVVFAFHGLISYEVSDCILSAVSGYGLRFFGAYILSATVTVASSICVYYTLRAVSPRLLHVLTGCRD